MKTFPKEFINMHEVAILLNQHGYDFNPTDIGNKLLHDTVADLVKEHGFRSYIYINGKVRNIVYTKGKTSVIADQTCNTEGYFYQNILPNEIDKYYNDKTNDLIPVLPYLITSDITKWFFLYGLEDINLDECEISYQVPPPKEQFKYEHLRFLQKELIAIFENFCDGQTYEEGQTYEMVLNNQPYNSDANKQLKVVNDQLRKRIDELEKQLETQSTNSVTNLDIQNLKKVAIKHFNKSLAIALIELDYKNQLRKTDIVSFIIPYMKELTLVLADGNASKAKALTVNNKTIYDTHLQGLDFKQGTQTKKDRERRNIELLFKRQIPDME